MAKTSSSSQIGLQPSASSSNPNLPSMTRRESSTSINTKSPTNTSKTFDAPTANTLVNGNTDNKRTRLSSTDFEDFTGLFSPSILETASRSDSADYLSFKDGKNTSPNIGSSTQGTSTNGQAQKPQIPQRTSSASITASPLSSMSQNGLDSSCGTTPESSAESPSNGKPSEATLNTINEETNTQTKPEGEFILSCNSYTNLGVPEANCVAAPVNVFKVPNSDINGIDWMAQQNGGAFDPVLFGDYRDPQDNILNSSFGDFFNDAFEPPIDFTSPYNTGESPNPLQSQKRNLMDEIEMNHNGEPEGAEFVTDVNPKQFLTCDILW